MCEVSTERVVEEEQLFQLPKNIRQIGLEDSAVRIYIEDYVMTYIGYLGKQSVQQRRIAVLLGNKIEREGESYIFIHGAMEVKHADCEKKWETETWEEIQKKKTLHFQSGKIVGFMVAHAGSSLNPNEELKSIHRDNFGEEMGLLILHDTLEREEGIYLYRQKEWNKVNGYYIYYEKNLDMQEYLLQEKGTVTKEKVEDQVVLQVKKKIEQLEQKKSTRGKRNGRIKGISLIGGVAIAVFILQQGHVKSGIREVFSDMKGQAVVGGQPKEEEKTLEEEEGMIEQKQAKITISQEEILEDTIEPIPTEEAIKEEAKEAVETITENKGEQYYTIQPGDTLVSICMKQFQSLDKMEEVMTMNGISDKNKIEAGQILKMWE